MDFDNIEGLSDVDLNNLYEDIVVAFCYGGYQQVEDDFGDKNKYGAGHNINRGGCELKLYTRSVCESKIFSSCGYYNVDYFSEQCYCDRYRNEKTWYSCN